MDADFVMTRPREIKALMSGTWIMILSTPQQSTLCKFSTNDPMANDVPFFLEIDLCEMDCV